ncbi:hypothetical protein ES332_D08G085900v1 [Gossypium tomentosum]|uniref:Prolamin-like domain-containing protein n=1 Tax=Gossypium tomentosum TaxID=34277 RepID=A0A5D2JS69_GOSTO|nr:hypothetical protein ES332_D08G085900v1 [Gossypium tomentosum]
MQNLIRRFQLPKTTVTKILTLCLLSFFLPAPLPSKNSFNLVPSVVSSLALMDELRQPFLKACTGLCYEQSRNPLCKTIFEARILPETFLVTTPAPDLV